MSDKAQRPTPRETIRAAAELYSDGGLRLAELDAIVQIEAARLTEAERHATVAEELGVEILGLLYRMETHQ